MKQFDKEIISICGCAVGSFLLMLILLICLCVMTSCTKTVYLPVETHSVSTDTLIQTRWLTDYRVEKDSVLVMVRGDTVLIKDTKWRTRDVEKTDTLYVAKTDTVRVKEPYPVEKIVEVSKPLKWWQTTLAWIGALFMFLFLSVTVYWLWRKFKQ